MQRVSSFLPSWDRRSVQSSKSGLFSWSNRSSTSNPLAKINTAAANAGRIQRESLWPSTLDVECDKAARILKTFSADGFLASPEDMEPSAVTSDSADTVKVLKKIPKRILQNAAGIAVFTCMRSGLWMTGSGGSGILIARKSDGTWSPPSGIMLHTPTLSFIIGVDVYDCVLVVSSLPALEAITRPSVTLGEDIGLLAGPTIPLGTDDLDLNWNDIGNTVLTYMKARGQLQSVNLSGCMLTERANENERFYSAPVTQMDVLAGNVDEHDEETMTLFEVLKMAEGRTDYRSSVINSMLQKTTPGDAVIASPNTTAPPTPRTAFGTPQSDDPDPFGILALEMAGLEIREAGVSRLRPASSLDFNHMPLSPSFSKFSRQSVDTYGNNSNRGSYMSSRTTRSVVTDAGTQTRTDGAATPLTTPSPGQSDDGIGRASFEQIPEIKEEEVDYTKIDTSLLEHLTRSNEDISTSKAEQEPVKEVAETTPVVERPTSAPKAEVKAEVKPEVKPMEEHDADDENEEDSDSSDLDDEEPVVFEVASVQPAKVHSVASRVVAARGNVVTIPKRIPPPLPLRSPARASRASKSEMGDVGHLRSPLAQSFSESDLQSDASPRNSTSSSAITGADVDVSFITIPDAAMTEETPVQEDEAEQGSKKLEIRIISPGMMKKSVEESEKTPRSVSEKASDASSVHSDAAEHSDSTNKDAPSLYTGTTGGRSSLDESTFTTPTSDKAPSITYGMDGDDTPKKEVKEPFSCGLDETQEVSGRKPSFELAGVVA
jgi:lipid-binding SYLF domain-containing protein